MQLIQLQIIILTIFPMDYFSILVCEQEERFDEISITIETDDLIESSTKNLNFFHPK